MNIAVLSGKGGTGKTLVSVNLACAAERAVYADCDVEEPNGHLFLKPEGRKRTPVTVTVPDLKPNLCTGCKRCVNFCKYNALAYVLDQLMIFPEICHSCGGCMLLCPAHALAQKEREIGAMEEGQSGTVATLTGCLNPGEESGVPIIKALMEKLPEEGTAVVDCPPGSACIVMESIRNADFCLLVAEPTLFGVHNLAMVYDLVRLFHKPLGVVLNKCLPEENPAEAFCLENGIRILGRIPFSEELGNLNSQGRIAVRENARYRELFQNLLKEVTKEAAL
ncbi:MAG: 4Fe-4S binding protein [Clostridiales bacterium]|jgi:MinD superfamily P-loop ATPase|nr:4Fe-4S binding protein [Clostridiales bacterium]